MEVKFRAWDKREKIMGEVNYIRFFKSQYTQVSVRFKEKGKVFDDWYAYGQEDGSDNIILMQYTGLKDKNGVEIYEGDIVVWSKYNGMGLCKLKYQIVWFKDEAGFKGISLEDNPSVLSLNNSRVGMEVIGNIYENPELLEVI